MAKKRRAGNGDGSVYKTKAGQWKAALPVKNLDGSTRHVVRNAKSLRHGKKKLDDLKRKYRTPTAGPSKLTVGGLLKSWLNNVPGRRPSTVSGYERVIRNHVLPRLGSIKVQSLTALAVADWAALLGKQGIGARTRVVAFSVLSMAFGYAMDLGLVDSNPCARVRRPKVESEEPDPFTIEEVEAILKQTRDDRLFALFQLAMTTGMRQGELFGLQWADIDWEAHTLSVKRQSVEHEGKVTFGPPKTRAGLRTLKLTPATVDALRSRRALALAEGFAGCNQVFVTTRGKVLRSSNFRNRVWNPLLKNLGLRHRGMHHLRHTYVTIQLKRLTPIHVISRIIGHSKASTTHDIYAHFQADDADLAANAISDIGEFA